MLLHLQETYSVVESPPSLRLPGLVLGVGLFSLLGDKACWLSCPQLQLSTQGRA